MICTFKPTGSVPLAGSTGLLFPIRESPKTISETAPVSTSTARIAAGFAAIKLYAALTAQTMPPSTTITPNPADDRPDFLRAILMSRPSSILRLLSAFNPGRASRPSGIGRVGRGVYLHMMPARFGMWALGIVIASDTGRKVDAWMVPTRGYGPSTTTPVTDTFVATQRS